MPTHILVNSLGLTHKGSMGFSKATIPDICKTPTPGGPVPMPYPNFSMSSTLTNGTTTVFAKGGKMIAVKGSRYTPTNGDEPGTVGGVKSNTFKQGTDWITYSFDVKMDGKNVCRDTDKKFHNNKNTADLMGNMNPSAAPKGIEKDVCCAIKKCDRKHYDISNVPPNSRCNALGTLKHSCVEKELKDNNKLNTELSFDMKTRLPTPILQQNGAAVSPRAAKKVLRYLWGLSKKAKLVDAVKRPDVCTGTGPTCDVYDAKFPCSEAVKSGAKTSGRMGSDMAATGLSRASPEQQQAYRRIAGKKGTVKFLSPGDCKNAAC